MRDLKRIQKTLDEIHKIWERQPDTRFFQLITNLQYEYMKQTGETGWKQESGVDMFYLEDYKFYQFLVKKNKEEL